MPASANDAHAGRIAFRHPEFAFYVFARFFIVIALEMQSVAVGWQVYDITRRPFDLGLVGLAQFLPGVLLFLVSGHAADRFDRRNLLATCYAGFAVCSALLLTVTLVGTPPSVYSIYAVLVLLGVVRSFNGATSRALLPQLVPVEDFPNAVAWNGTAFQTATIMGPAIGGLLYALSRGPAPVYATSMIAALVALASLLRVRARVRREPEPVSLQSVFAGLRYIWRQKIILGSISLDLFAVLLGGAVALLPIYARDILKTGPWGLGVLRSAPAVGAAGMAILLAHRPLRGRAGPVMLWCVAGFGIFTVVFGLSRNLELSLAALLLAGAMDMVSVIIRGTLVQLATPDEMQGRVSAVDMIFVGASNEFGQFESGLTAQWFGTVPAVILGGLGTLVVTALWAWLFPALRRTDRIPVLRH
jgi:MFS family permease